MLRRRSGPALFPYTTLFRSLTDSGYDKKKIQHAIADKHGHCIIALGKTRSVQSTMLALTTPTSKQWCHIATFFRHHRRLKDRKSTRLNSSHVKSSYAVVCLK